MVVKSRIRKKVKTSSTFCNCSAMKSACNELKGLASLFQCRQHELRFPLQTLIHYRGFCTVAVALVCTPLDFL
jgi:hypothetical protein